MGFISRRKAEVIGEIVDFGGSEIPKGYLPCNGATLQIEDYPELFSVIGTQYGGDGITTFNLPDKAGRSGIGEGGGFFSQYSITNRKFGATTHTLATNETPNHRHAIGSHRHDSSILTAAAAMFHSNGFWQYHRRVNSLSWTNNRRVNITDGNWTVQGNVQRSAGARIIGNTDTPDTTNTGTMQNIGSSSSHENMQPFLVLNHGIRY